MGKQLTKAPQVAEEWRKLAEARCVDMGERLTPARLAAYAEMLASDRPVSAYELIARLEQRHEKKIAPLTVYRHLDFLIRVGLVHRLESTHSYVVCAHPDHAHGSRHLLCSTCGRADELDSSRLEKLIEQIAGQHGFQLEKSVVEISGQCEDCAATPI